MLLFIVVAKVFFFCFNSCCYYNIPRQSNCQLLFWRKNAQIFALFFYFKNFNFWIDRILIQWYIIETTEVFLFQKHIHFGKKRAAAKRQLLFFHFSCSDIFRQNADKLCLVLSTNRTFAIRFRHLLMNLCKTLCLILFSPWFSLWSSQKCSPYLLDICSSCFMIIFFTISPPMDPAWREVRSPL